MWTTMTIKKLNHLSMTALAFGTMFALSATAMAVNAAAPNNGMGTAVARTTTLAQGDVSTGVLPHTQPMHIVVALKIRNGDQLDALIAAHQMLTPAQFTTQYAPTLMQAQAVATYLRQTGFRNVVIAPNRLLVSADGTAETAQAAFQTSFARVQTHDGRAAFANTSDAHMPPSLQGSVLSVIGLQNVHMAHTNGIRLLPHTVNTVTGAGPISHNPNEFSSIYGGTGVPTAAGVTVGIITVGDVTQSLTDLNTFTTANGLATVTTQVVNNGSGDQGVSEWNMDSQDIVGAGGGQVGQIIFYSTPSFSFADLLAGMNSAVIANQAKIINMSIGGCETSAQHDGTAAAANQVLQVGVAQGQTFSVSVGDTGADECGNGGITPQWPGSSPYVVGAGGTHLNASTTTWNGEVVWNDLPFHGAPGGSPSTFQLKPSWQNTLVPGTTRGVPDIAFDADPFTGANVYVYGGLQLWGGTSLAAPIFAGLWARVIAVKGTSIGFAAPWLYQLPATDFHDVLSGNNGGETAKAGYDFASGRGSMILSSAINHIGVANPLVANFTVTTTGLIAKFTDSSTDGGGMIASHAWTFGDNSTSKLASPSHIYFKAGTYSVAETVADATGFASTKTVSVKVGK
jgi:subtilase family serine protease